MSNVNTSLFSTLSCERCNNTVENMLRCSSCKLFYYCSEKCQRNDWKIHRYICSCHKTASKDSKFISLPASIRLEIITTRLVLSAFSDRSTIPIELPEWFIVDLPRLATHWFTLAVVVQSLGTRDISAFFDFEWDTDRKLLDVRIAALFSYWRSVWKPSLTQSREAGEDPFKQLIILQSIDYTRFLNVPSSKGKSQCWRIRFSDCLLMQTTSEVRALYSQFYLELGEELELLALGLAGPSWKQQLEHRMEWQNWVSKPKEKVIEREKKEDEEEESALDLTALTSSQVLGVLSIHSFYCLLNAAAASDHFLSIVKVSEILFRRGFFPKSPLRVLLTSKIRLEPCLLLLAIVTNRFLAELNEHGSAHGTISESSMLIDLKMCGTNNHVQQPSPNGQQSTASCRWCSWQWDVSRLSRLTLCLLFLVRVLPLKHATSWKEAETLRKWIYPLSQHALRHGIDWLREKNQEKNIANGIIKKEVDKPQDENYSLPVFLSSFLTDPTYSSFFTAYTHFVCICSEVSELQSVINASEYWCIALSLRYDYWTLFDLSFLLVTSDSSVLTLFSRLAKSRKDDEKPKDEPTPEWILKNSPPLPLFQIDLKILEDYSPLKDPDLTTIVDNDLNKGDKEKVYEPISVVRPGFAEKIIIVAKKYEIPLCWARRAANHPSAGYEVTEVLVSFFADLLHRDSCPNNLNIAVQQIFTGIVSKCPPGSLPVTACGCSVLPSKEIKAMKNQANVVKGILQPPSSDLCFGGCLQRLCSSYEFELDYQYAHGYKDATSNTNEYALRQRLVFLPLALNSAGPMSLDLLRRLGWEMLCESRFSAIGLALSPILAIRCCLLHSLLRPAAWNTYMVAEKIHLQLISPSKAVQEALKHDVQLLKMANDPSTPTNVLLAGIAVMLGSIHSELLTLQKLWKEGVVALAILEYQKARSQLTYSNVDEYKPMMEFALELCDYAENIAVKQSASELSKDRLVKIRERRMMIADDLVCLTTMLSSNNLKNEFKHKEGKSSDTLLDGDIDSYLVEGDAEANHAATEKHKHHHDNEDDLKKEVIAKMLEKGIDKASVRANPNSAPIVANSDGILDSRKALDIDVDLSLDQNKMMQESKEELSISNEISVILNQIEITQQRQTAIRKQISDLEIIKNKVIRQTEQLKNSSNNLSNSHKGQQKYLQQQEKSFAGSKSKFEAEVSQWELEKKNLEEVLAKETGSLQDEKLKLETRRTTTLEAIKNEEEIVQNLQATGKSAKETIKSQQDAIKKMQEEMNKLKNEIKTREDTIKKKEKNLLSSTFDHDEEYSRKFKESQEQFDATMSAQREKLAKDIKELDANRSNFEIEQEAKEAEQDENAMYLDIMDSQFKSQNSLIDEENLSIAEQLSTIMIQKQNVEQERESIRLQRIQLAEWFQMQQLNMGSRSIFSN